MSQLSLITMTIIEKNIKIPVPRQPQINKQIVHHNRLHGFTNFLDFLRQKNMAKFKKLQELILRLVFCDKCNLWRSLTDWQLSLALNALHKMPWIYFDITIGLFNELMVNYTLRNKCRLNQAKFYMYMHRLDPLSTLVQNLGTFYWMHMASTISWRKLQNGIAVVIYLIYLKLHFNFIFKNFFK